ncbi:MAG: hypothetical protein SF052_18240 [Bacteroidia bacterium]|nr:hypothetical protein [Bacteroidia bacterium]
MIISLLSSKKAIYISLALLAIISLWTGCKSVPQSENIRRLLYVASPGIRNYLEFGGHGVLVYDIDQGHSFVKRISLDGYGLNEKGEPLNIKGICAHAKTGKLYVTTTRHLICLDLNTEKVIWEKTYPEGCDRMSISPDGKIIYLPSFEKDRWYVVSGKDGSVITEIVPNSRAHNTVYGIDGKYVYLAGLGSPYLTVAETQNHTTARTIGPFSHSIRPFTVNGNQTLCFVNVNDLLGFEVGDMVSGKMIHRVEVAGYEKGAVKRHGCPSHGIGLTPNEKELWVVDGANSMVHFFDATVMPPKQMTSVALREQPGWVTFSIDGSLAWLSTGEVFDVKTHTIAAALSDEEGRMVQSEKVIEIDFKNGKPFLAGDQFGRGYITTK